MVPGTFLVVFPCVFFAEIMDGIKFVQRINWCFFSIRTLLQGTKAQIQMILNEYIYIYMRFNKKKMSTIFDHLYIYIPGILWWHPVWLEVGLQVTHPKELETAEAKGITSDPWDSENPKTLELCIWKKMEIFCLCAWPGSVMNKDWIFG